MEPFHSGSACRSLTFIMTYICGDLICAVSCLVALKYTPIIPIVMSEFSIVVGISARTDHDVCFAPAPKAFRIAVVILIVHIEDFTRIISTVAGVLHPNIGMSLSVAVLRCLDGNRTHHTPTFFRAFKVILLYLYASRMRS